MDIGDLVVMVVVLGGGGLALLGLFILFACTLADDPESWADSLEDAIIITHLVD